MPSPFYTASVVLFQLHECVVSHMQVLATPFLSVHDSKHSLLLDPYYCVCSWGSNVVASGIDRHPDGTEIYFGLQIQGNRKLIPCFCTFTPHAQRERGKVIGRGVHIYICGRKKNLNRILEIDSPFQTLTVGLLVEFID